MNDKPNLVLTEKDLLEGIKNPSADFSTKLKTDLISILEFLIENQSDMKINFEIQYEQSCSVCGTYRSVAGWWAYWLEIPIHDIELEIAPKYEVSTRFKNTLYKDDLWKGFNDNVWLELPYTDYHYIFFGYDHNISATLFRRLKLAKALQIK